MHGIHEQPISTNTAVKYHLWFAKWQKNQKVKKLCVIAGLFSLK
jgi:hypothetical protein